MDINDKGQIVGMGFEIATGDCFGVLLTPPGAEVCPPDLDGNGVLNLSDFFVLGGARSAPAPRGTETGARR